MVVCLVVLRALPVFETLTLVTRRILFPFTLVTLGILFPLTLVALGI